MSETSIPLVVVGVGVLGTYFFSGWPQKIGMALIPVGLFMFVLDSRS